MNASEAEPRILGLYVLAFTPDVLESEDLQTLTHVAVEMLKRKDRTFSRLFEATLASNTTIEIANVEFVPTMHDPQTMQTTLAGWLRRQYQIVYAPRVGETFFPHGMRDDGGTERMVLFYFNVESP